MPILMQVLYGPYRDQRVYMPDADAAQAIADGWAIDPHAPPHDPPFDVTVREKKKARRSALRLPGRREPAPEIQTLNQIAMAPCGPTPEEEAEHDR
jgi:hypothetical protein